MTLARGQQYAMTPQPIQRKRTKGWRMPPNTVYVGRGSLLGNPYRVDVWGIDLALSLYRDRALPKKARLPKKSMTCTKSTKINCVECLLPEPNPRLATENSCTPSEQRAFQVAPRILGQRLGRSAPRPLPAFPPCGSSGLWRRLVLFA